MIIEMLKPNQNPADCISLYNYDFQKRTEERMLLLEVFIDSTSLVYSGDKMDKATGPTRKLI